MFLSQKSNGLLSIWFVTWKETLENELERWKSKTEEWCLSFLFTHSHSSPRLALSKQIQRFQTQTLKGTQFIFTTCYFERWAKCQNLSDLIIVLKIIKLAICNSYRKNWILNDLPELTPLFIAVVHEHPRIGSDGESEEGSGTSEDPNVSPTSDEIAVNNGKQVTGVQLSGREFKV